MRSLNKYTAAVIQVVAAGVFWGIIGIFVRTLSSLGFAPMQLVAIRAVISAVFMFVLVGIRSPKNIKIQLKDWWMFAGTGICSFSFFNFCYFNAINIIPLSTAAILLYTAPVFVAVMSAVIFKEKITKFKIAALILAFAGCAAASGISNIVINATGLIYGLLSGFLYALYSIFGKVALKKYSSETVTLYTFVFASAGSVPMSCGSGSPVSMSVPLFFYLVLFALLCSAVPYILYTNGLTVLPPDKASVMASVEPVTASFVGMIAFAEPFNIGSVIGLICIIAAIVLLSLKSGQDARVS